MKLILSIFFNALFFSSVAQSASPATKTAVMSKFDKNLLSSAVSSSQATRNTYQWNQQTLQHPEDAGAWLNYYQWIDRNGKDVADKKETLEKVIGNSSKYIKGTWQFSLMQFLVSSKRDSSALFDAVNKADDKTLLYPYAIQFAIISGNKSLLSKYCALMAGQQTISKNMFRYHYNTLMSANQHAFVYAKGLGDLVPLAIMQQQYNVRKDITLKYFEGEIENETNSYLCISSGKEILQKFPLAEYTGLLVKIKPDEKNEMQRHIDGDFDQTIFTENVELNEEERAVYRNYLPGLILLYKGYKKENSPHLQSAEQMMNSMASLTGTTTLVQKMLAE